MTTAAASTIAHPIEADDLASRVDGAIRRFLDGADDGHAVLDALFGDALDEPIPARLTALVRAR